MRVFMATSLMRAPGFPIRQIIVAGNEPNLKQLAALPPVGLALGLLSCTVC